MIKIIPELENISFFIVDDLKAARNQLIADLRAAGFKGEFVEAESITQALELFVKSKIDFVICDWNLPDGIGIDFLKKFRLVKKFSKTPFMMCTTNDEVAYFLQAIQEGANDFLVKPWTSEDLLKKVNTCWRFINKA